MNTNFKPSRTRGVYTRRGSGTSTFIEGYIDAYETNPVGAFIWSLCDGANSAADIVTAVADHFEEEEARVAPSTLTFLEQLARLGFIDAE